MDEFRRNWMIYNVRNFLNANLKFTSVVLKFLFRLKNYLFGIKESKKNNKFKDRHKGDVCFILGNGISIDEINVDYLNNFHVFACNEIFYHKDFNKLRIDYYTVVEPYFGSLFGYEYKKEVTNLYAEISSNFEKKKTQMFFHLSLKSFFKKSGIVFYSNLLNYFVPPIISSNENFGSRIGGSYSAMGALPFMVSTAKYMGFSKVFLVGCGYTYSPRMEYHFYARPIFKKTNSVLLEMEKFAKERDLKIFRFDTIDSKVIPIFISKQKEDNSNKQFREMYLSHKEGVFEIINVVPKSFESPIFKSCGIEELPSSVSL
jgi:hypothetical protein